MGEETDRPASGDPWAVGVWPARMVKPSDRVQAAADRLREDRGGPVDMLLIYLDQWAGEPEILPTVGVTASRLFGHLADKHLLRSPFEEVREALRIIVARPGVATVMTRLVTSAAIWGRKHAPRFGDLTTEDLSALAQGDDLQWLHEHGVPRRLQLLVVDALRCRLDVPGE